jgi:hypothetical protein
MPGPRRRKQTKENQKAIKPKRSQATAKTSTAREKQLVNLAVKEAEKRIKNGTATSQMIIHYLKMGSATEQLAREKLRNENLLLKAKTDALASAKRVEELYSEALNAMREYSGQAKPNEDDDDYYD